MTRNSVPVNKPILVLQHIVNVSDWSEVALQPIPLVHFVDFKVNQHLQDQICLTSSLPWHHSKWAKVESYQVQNKFRNKYLFQIVSNDQLVSDEKTKNDNNTSGFDGWLSSKKFYCNWLFVTDWLYICLRPQLIFFLHKNSNLNGGFALQSHVWARSPFARAALPRPHGSERPLGS